MAQESFVDDIQLEDFMDVQHQSGKHTIMFCERPYVQKSDIILQN